MAFYRMCSITETCQTKSIQIRFSRSSWNSNSEETNWMDERWLMKKNSSCMHCMPFYAAWSECERQKGKNSIRHWGPKNIPNVQFLEGIDTLLRVIFIYHACTFMFKKRKHNHIHFQSIFPKSARDVIANILWKGNLSDSPLHWQFWEPGKIEKVHFNSQTAQWTSSIWQMRI